MIATVTPTIGTVSIGRLFSCSSYFNAGRSIAASRVLFLGRNSFAMKPRSHVRGESLLPIAASLTHFTIVRKSKLR